MNQQRFLIDGMGCPSCAAKIEQAVSTLVGVESAAVHFDTQTLSVSYDENQLKSDAILAAVSTLGYTIKEE